MSKAFVFLNCDIGAEKGIISQMDGISGVRASEISGIYDIVAEVDADSDIGIGQSVRKLRSINSVRSCLAMMVAEKKSAINDLNGVALD